jgi:hypothetical protein
VASAAENSDTRASLTLSFYNAELVAGDSKGVISVDYDVQSSKMASFIGVESIKIYKADGSYVTTITGTTSNGLVESNSDICKSFYDYKLTSGVSYYAKVKVFATVGSEYDSRTITTSTVKAP